MLGIERCVIVQSGCHGFDNRVVADAIAAKQGRYCGIALVPLTVSDAELRRLHAQGFRGVRFSYMKHLRSSPPPAEVIAFTLRLADLGWQLHLHFDPALIDDFAPLLTRCRDAGSDRPHGTHRRLARCRSAGVSRATRAAGARPHLGQGQRRRPLLGAGTAVHGRRGAGGNAGRKRAAIGSCGAPIGRTRITIMFRMTDCWSTFSRKLRRATRHGVRCWWTIRNGSTGFPLPSRQRPTIRRGRQR